MSSRTREPAYAKRKSLKKQWYKHIKRLVLTLESEPERAIVNENDEQRLGVQVSNISDFDEDWDPDLIPRFFTPLPLKDLPFSPCDLSRYPAEDQDHSSYWPVNSDRGSYYYGRCLADVITGHRDELQAEYPSMWHLTSPGYLPGIRYIEVTHKEYNVLVPHIFYLSSKRRPHLIIVMISDHEPEGDLLLRSEVLAISSCMKYKFNQMFDESSMTFPVMAISILNTFQVRILQGHFDGNFHIRRSKIIDFDVSDHEAVMKTIMCWMRSTPHGDITLSSRIPYFTADGADEDDDSHDKNGGDNDTSS